MSDYPVFDTLCDLLNTSGARFRVLAHPAEGKSDAIAAQRHAPRTGREGDALHVQGWRRHHRARGNSRPPEDRFPQGRRCGWPPQGHPRVARPRGHRHALRDGRRAAVRVRRPRDARRRSRPTNATPRSLSTRAASTAPSCSTRPTTCGSRSRCSPTSRGRKPRKASNTPVAPSPQPSPRSET